MPKVLIIDYGVGNLLSLECALEKVGLETEIGLSKQKLQMADAIALPGVGNFSVAANKLSPFKQEILDCASAGTPVLGICLGLQLFFQESEEGPGEGLSRFRGKNVRLPNNVKVPHMGWNTLCIVKDDEFLDGIENGAFMYFVHSLHPIPEDEGIVCSKTGYGTTFVSAIADKNVYGTQFHPEKSGDVGLKILDNFAKIVSR
jgi:imidazole glycerol-phosphate synthase subunit HisH